MPGGAAMRLVGWRGLGISATEEARVRELIDRHLHRILLLVQDLQDISIHAKQASKQGTRHRYDIHVTVLGDGHVFYADALDWDIRAAVHKAFSAIENQAKRREWHGREHLDAYATKAEPLLRM